MDLPHTGYKDERLIHILSQEFDLYIKGPYLSELSKGDAVSTFYVCTKDKVSVDISYEGDVSERYDIDRGYRKIHIKPLFFENKNYQIIIRNKSEKELKFWHDNKLIREKIDYIDEDKMIMTGTINFENDIGFSEFKIFLDGDCYLEFVIEVFPSKIDYKDDYIEILKDISNEIYNLVFDFYRKTYMLYDSQDKQGNSETEFFSILTAIFNKFISSIDIIIKNPHHQLKEEIAFTDDRNIKKIDSITIKWIEKNPQYVNNKSEVYLPRKVLAKKKFVTYDTLENRLIKYIVGNVIKKIDSIKRDYYKLDRVNDDEIVKYMDYMKNELIKKYEYSFLKEVGTFNKIDVMSLVLYMAPGYRDVYKYYLMLNRILVLNGEMFKISLKGISQLYEYWCFIKIIGLIKSKYNLIKQDFIKVNRSGIFITLTKGIESKVEFENPKNGERIILKYNPFYYELPTVSQKPDTTLSIEKKGCDMQYNFIFDVKYRLNMALEGTEYKKKYLTPGPEEDDINTMHRYRDSIVFKQNKKINYEKNMFGAYVLFPYKNEKEYENHRFYKSIEEVNIGGIPFLPKATSLFEKLLDELIDESYISTFERSILPSGFLEYINRLNLDERNVLVGVLRNKEQLDVALNYNFYHIPYDRIKNDRLLIKYVALYQSKDKFGDQAGVRYFGEIDSVEILKRNEIKEIPKDDERLYIKFKVKGWSTLNNVIKPREYWVGSHIYTNINLLKTAEYLPELCIKSKDEYRLYMELKRLSQISLEYVDKKLDEINDGFILNGFKISIQDGNIKVMKDNIQRKFDLYEFYKKPIVVVNQIRDFISKY